MTIGSKTASRRNTDRSKKYLLYIDLLGFEQLVRSDPARVDDLYRIVASLNVHDHWGFSVVGFSDTILIHNAFTPSTAHEHHYVVMYSCEFAQDLMRRLAGRSAFFRAVLVYGEFEHYLLNEQPYYYGSALVDAYRSEKAFKVTGLLMDDACASHCDIFSFSKFAEGWNYVFLTQGLDSYEDTWQGMTPLDMTVLDECGEARAIGLDLETLHSLFIAARDHPDPGVRMKHENTLALHRMRYPRVFAALEKHEFRMEYVNRAFDWSSVRTQLEESYEWGSTRTEPKPGATGKKQGVE